MSAWTTTEVVCDRKNCDGRTRFAGGKKKARKWALGIGWTRIGKADRCPQCSIYGASTK